MTDNRFLSERLKKEWYDPRNWDQTFENDKFTGTDSNSPVPHSERIPCPNDDVDFPIGVAFRTEVSVGVVKVASLKINGILYDNHSIQKLLRSNLGKLLFSGSSDMNIMIEDQRCPDETGCACGNDDPLLLPKICSFVASECPPIACLDPVKPEGFCCPICASAMSVTYAEGFKYNLLANLVRTYMFKDSYSSVKAYFHKTFTDKVQLVFVDTGAQGAAHRLASFLTDYLKKDSQPQQGGIYSIRSIQLKSSQKWSRPASKSSRVLWILFGMLTVLGLLYYLQEVRGWDLMPQYLRRLPFQHGHDPNFVRFEGDDDRVEMELGSAPRMEPVGAQFPSMDQIEERSLSTVTDLVPIEGFSSRDSFLSEGSFANLFKEDDNDPEEAARAQS